MDGLSRACRWSVRYLWQCRLTRLTFPPSGARLATLLCQGGRGGGQGKEGVLPELVRSRWTEVHNGGHLANWGGLGDLRHDTAIIEGI